jgi:hypothetical protein
MNALAHVFERPLGAFVWFSTLVSQGQSVANSATRSPAQMLLLKACHP